MNHDMLDTLYRISTLWISQIKFRYRKICELGFATNCFYGLQDTGDDSCRYVFKRAWKEMGKR